MKKIMSADQAVEIIRDDDTVWIVSSGGGVNDPYLVLKHVEERFLRTGHPKNLTLCHSSGIGDKNGGGADRFAHEGMVRKVIGSHWTWCPQMTRMVNKNMLEGYVLPQGVMVQLARGIAGGKPGVISHVGLGTSIDPRLEGGKLNKVCRSDLSEVIWLNQKEWLFYKAFPIDVTILRGTTADEDGNITMECEGVVLESISAAQAAKNSGGRVIAQVKRVVNRGMLDPKCVKVPGVLVDAVVMDPNQKQSYDTVYNSGYTGEMKKHNDHLVKFELDERKIIARRAAMELFPDAVVNLGFGIPVGVASVAAEEHMVNQVVFSVEQGVIGGVPANGYNFGMSMNPVAIVDEPYQFDWYDGGGLDIAFLSFAEIDACGNVNVSKFGDKIAGVGGFVNISQSSKKVVFCGTFTASGLEIGVSDNSLKILQEGKFIKLVNHVCQISFSGKYARDKGQHVIYITERAVFELKQEGVMIIEIAPGVNLEDDILKNMNFIPLISENLKLMDGRIFNSKVMGL